MKCPHCNSKLRLCVYAINEYEINNDVVDDTPIESNEIINRWVECVHCFKSSETSDILAEFLDNLLHG